MVYSNRDVWVARALRNLFTFGATAAILRWLRLADMRPIPLRNLVAGLLALTLAFATVETWWVIRGRSRQA